MTYYEAFKKVRNRIRNYDARALILGCISRLHLTDWGSMRNMQTQPPWLLLLLTKWTLIHGDFSEHRKKPMTDTALNQLINMMQGIENHLPLPSYDPTVLQVLRPIAYQQFWHQYETFLSGYARQAMLFGNLETTHSFHRWFSDHIGVSIPDFLDLTLMVAVHFIQPNTHYFEEDPYFKNVAHSFPPDSISRFLSAISRTPEQAQQYLGNLEEAGRLDWSEFRETTPLVRYPLLNLGSRYYYYSRRLLTYSLETFLYDTLRRYDPERFMSIFGHIFEKYVRNAFDFSGLEYFDEEQILQLAGKHGKRVDFLIVEDGVNVFVDAKGVEIGHLGMTSFRPDIVTDKVKSSVVKGIQQGFETVQHLQEAAEPGIFDLNRQNNFLLLITYKDLLLGTGHDFYESYARERLHRIIGSSTSKCPIPLEHIYIISAEEFDRLIACISGHKGRLSQLLKAVAIKDSNPQTKKLLLYQHLEEVYGDVGHPAYLKRTFDQYGERVRQRLKRDTRSVNVITNE